MNTAQEKKNIDTIRKILMDEIKGQIQNALDKMDKNYKMTWVYKAPKTGEVFPSEKINEGKELEDVYIIKGREYYINHIIASGDVVMAEMTEIYPDIKTGKIYSTPMAIVWEFKDGKIIRGRHYCDPQISYLGIPKEEIIKKIYEKRMVERIF